jgi:hypothetical protein
MNLSRDIAIDFVCGCYAHADCLPDDYNGSESECPFHNPEQSTLTGSVVPLVEPVIEGEDWISNPIAPPTKLRQAYMAAKNYTKKDIEDIDSPFVLLKQKTPLEWIIRNKKWGLSHMHAMGVRLEDFLANGYTIDDLCIYKDIGGASSSAARGRPLKALVRLGLSPDVLIDYQDKLPIEVMTERFGLTPAYISSRAFNGGLGFHPTQGLRTPHSTEWSVDNLIYLGFKFDDLLRCGLNCKEQWDDLEVTTREQRAALGATKALISQLPSEALIEDDEEDEPEEVVAPPPPVRIREPAPIEIDGATLLRMQNPYGSRNKKTSGLARRK